MPGKQPPRAMTGDLRPGQAAGTPEPPSQPPGEPPCRTAKGPCEAGGNGSEPREPQPPQAGHVTATAPHPGTPSRSSSPWWPVKGGSPRAPPGKGPAQARARRGARGSGGPQQLYRLSLSSLRAQPAPEEPTEAPQPPETEGPLGPGPGAPLTPSLQPAPEELGFQRCFQESCSSFTATNYTSPSPAPRPPGRAPQAGSTSPSPPASFPEFQGSEAGAWPLAAGDGFQGANFGVHPAEPAPFLEGNRPSSSPGASAFQYPFPAVPADAAQPEFANGALVFTFHQSPGPWREEPVGPSPAFPLPTPPAPPPLPGYTSRAASLDPPGNPRGALGAPGAAPPALSPFPASLHESLTKAHPERPPAPQEGVASPRGPPGALPPVHFPGEAFGSPGARGVGASPGPLDKELATAGPTPTPRPPLWDGDGETLSLMDPAAAAYTTTTLAPPAAPRGAFFDGQPGPGQQLCLPQSLPLPWPQVVPTTGPGPARLDLLSQLPFPAGAPEWQGGSRGTLGGPSSLPGLGDKLAGPSNGPGPPDSGSPALFSYHGLKDSAAPPLFFGVTQPQGSPRLPPPRVMGASPSESPLPSPATNTAGSSSCSSLSPLSSSPANPSSEDGQLPGALGPAAFLHHAAHPQEPGGAFPSPEPLHALPLGYQPGLPETVPFPAEGLQGEGPFKCLEEAPLPGAGPELGRGGLEGFSRGPPPYPTQHFTLSSASLAQLDVLLTCRQCDQNYSNLAAFLQHRQFCGLLLARAKDGPPGLPMAAPTPKASLLAHARTASFLLDGDVRAEGKDDPLRVGFFPSLPAAPLPLPSSELDMEDDAKLDSLITEALNGLEYQSDSPEIDSSFIDVFADEEPSGPRGPGTGPTPKARPGAPAPTPKAPTSGDEGRLPPSRPETRSLGPAGQPRRGKRFKWLREELDPADAKGPGRGARACLRPRRGTNRAEPPPLRPWDLRTQGTKGPADPSQQAPQATGLRMETRSSRRLRLPPGRDARKRSPRGGTWSKELIQKIVQQKNQLSRRQVRSSPGVLCSLATERHPPGAWDGRVQAYDCTSGSEDEGSRQPGSSFKGQCHHGGRRQRQGEKRTDVDTAQGPRDEQDQQKPRKAVRQEAGAGRGSPTPEAQGGPPPSPSESLKARSPSQRRAAGRGPPAPDGPLAASSTETLEESLPSLAISQETSSPAPAEEQPTAVTALLGTDTRLSAAAHVTGSASLATTGPVQPGTDSKPQPSGGLPNVVPQAASPTPGPGGLPEAPQATGPLVPPNREDSPSRQPGALLQLTAAATDTARTKPSTLFFKNHFSGDPVGVPVAEEGSPSSKSSPREPFLGPGDLAGRPRGTPCPRPLALDTPSVGELYLCQGGGGPQHPRDPPSTTEGDPGTAGSPLTLESTALFGGLPEDGFDPLLYDRLSAGRECHTPFLCTDLHPRKPLWDPPCPSLSPEKDWPGLEAGSPVQPDHLGGQPPGRQPPAAGTASPRPPALPGKVSECGGAFGSSLPEDELEIKRLVTELESQLQTSSGASGAPRVLPEADSGRGPKPPSPPPGHQAPAPQEPLFLAEELAALRNSRPFPGGVGTAIATTAGQPCPRETALPPSTQEGTASGAPGCSPRPCHRLQLVLQEGPVSKTEPAATAREHGVHPDICPPQPPEREASGSPAAHRTPDLAFQGDEAVALHALPAPASKAGKPRGPGLPQPVVERPHFEGNESREAPSTPLPDAGRPQDPATSPLRQLQLLVARAAEREDNTPANPQGLPLANTRSPRPSGPAVLTVPAPAGHPRGPGADGHLDLQGQAESLAQEHKGRRQARQLQPGNCGSPGEPKTLPTRPTGSTDWLQGQQKGSGAAWGLQHAASPAPATAAAHAPRGPEDWTPEKAAGLGLKWLLCAGETPGPPGRDQTHSTLLPAEATSPVPCGLEHLPQEDPPAAPAGVLGAPGELGGLCLASPPCRALPSPHPLPARAPTWTRLQAPTGAGAEQPPAAPPSVSSSPCAPGEGLAHCPSLGDPGLRSLTPAHGREGSVLRTLEGSRKEGQQGSPTQATPSPTVGAIAPRVTVKAAGLPVPTADGMAVVRGWLRSDPGAEAPDPHGRGAPPPTSPGPPCPTAHLGPREGQLTTAVPTDLSPRGSKGPGAHVCLEGEVGGSSGGREDTGTPGAGCSGFTEVPEAGAGGPTAASPSAAPLSRASFPSSTAGDFGSVDSQSHRNILHRIPQGEPPSPQDTKQKPRGSRKKLVSMGNGRWKKDKTAGVTPVTCEICASSFRSKPGLSRHRARKHRPPEGATSLPGRAALPAHEALEPSATPAQSPRRRSRRAPGKEKPGNMPVGRSPAATPSPGQGSAAPGDSPGPETPEELGQGPGPLGTPDHPPSPHPPLRDPSHQGDDTKFPASRPQRADGPSKARACPRGAGRQGAGPRPRRQPGDPPGSSEGKPSKTGRKPRARREKRGTPDLESSPHLSPDVISGRPSASPETTPAGFPSPPGPGLPPQGWHGTDGSQLLLATAPGPGVTADVEEMDPGTPSAEQTRAQEPPGELTVHRGGTGGLSAGEGRGMRILGVCIEPSQAAGHKAAEGGQGSKSRTGEGVLEGHEPHRGLPGPPETPGAEASGAACSCLQALDGPEAPGQAQECPGNNPKAHSPGPGDALSLFDDETSFSRLFPLGARRTRNNPRVYGTRRARPKPPAPQPSSPATQALSPQLPTDLSDSGSLCLSHEGAWDDEAFLLDGLLSSRGPGVEPWTPSPSPWAPELGTAPASMGPTPPRPCPDDMSECIPELHMVPAAWRGLELRAAADEAGSSCGEASPEPPTLERERYEPGPPGTTSLPLLPAVDYKGLSTKFEMPGPGEGPTELPDTSVSNSESAANSPGRRSARTREASGAGGLQGRARHAEAGRGARKCRVCFQRFHGLAELDLHKLAHSPSPPPTCYMCVERRFGSRQLLREHLREKHVQGKAGPWACGMCLKEVADVWMYNEHLREHAVRFARRGQARTSLQGLPGGWEEDSAVTCFLSSFVGPAAKPRGKTSGGPGGASAPETDAGRETPKQRAKPKARARAADQGGGWTPDSPSTRATGSCSMASPGPAPKPWRDGEAPVPAPPVHRACRDPSRHCHHCGKQFPKPFKLQRHLAVHSPQRAYLCPHCPRVYGEPRELQGHLGQEHGAWEEPEPPHTPLYACELCAVVMHIIRRSFVCSTCNYTFAKKEQFDRHMDKHLRKHLEPFTFRRVRRPGAPGQRVPAREGALPSKRRKVAVPGSPPGPCMDQPLSLGCSPAPTKPPSPALLQPSPAEAPGAARGQAETQEEPDLRKLPPPFLSPFPAAVADGKGDPKPDAALASSEDKAALGSPGPLPQETSLPQPEARSRQDAAGQAARLFSGKRRAPGAPSKRAPSHRLEGPSSVRKENPPSTCHMGPGGRPGGTAHRDRAAVSTPSKAPKFPPQPRKATASPTELARDTEDRPKSTPHKAKAEGGSQPQPASGQLQSETASTPAKPHCPGQSPTPDKPPPQAPAKGCSKGPHRSLGARENPEGERRRKGRAPGPAQSESAGGPGRAPSVPDKPPRNPRKQATPSRVLPPKPSPSSHISRTLLHPGHTPGDFGHRKEGPGKAFSGARPLHRPPKRGRAVHGAESANPHAHRTAGSQSDLLSQLFGQRLTSFKIPLKKDSAE